MKESTRYNRQIILPEIGEEGQRKLSKSKVLVIGAGGLGAAILPYLAAAGVGQIGIVDDDVIEISNLHRQILFNEEDVNKFKVDIAEKKLEKINSKIKIK